MIFNQEGEEEDGCCSLGICDRLCRYESNGIWEPPRVSTLIPLSCALRYPSECPEDTLAFVAVGWCLVSVCCLDVAEVDTNRLGPCKQPTCAPTLWHSCLVEKKNRTSKEITAFT